MLSLTERAKGGLQTCPNLVSDKQPRITSRLCTDEKEEGKNSKARRRLLRCELGLPFRPGFTCKHDNCTSLSEGSEAATPKLLPPLS